MEALGDEKLSLSTWDKIAKLNGKLLELQDNGCNCALKDIPHMSYCRISNLGRINKDNVKQGL